MAINLTPEQKAKGKDNFHQAVGKLAEADKKPDPNRRQFMGGLIAAGAVLPVGAAAYFGYSSGKGKSGGLDKPVKAALIGAGDEGGVLVGEHNPAYLEFVAYCDIRPSNQKRIFRGETYSKPTSPRRGFNFHYGTDAQKKIKRFDTIKDLLEDTSLGIEAVVIALPLHLHAPVSIAAMKAGKHVLCEKLMAWNIRQCKAMIGCQADMLKEEKKDLVLAIGHQRHYSMLYAHAVEVLKSGILGDINHIRAQWHRNNSKYTTRNKRREYEGGWHFATPKEDKDSKELADRLERAKKSGRKEDWEYYDDLRHLVQWRLYERTGGGLMAELGSHQMDACSIFLAALARDNSDILKDDVVRPLAVSAVGGKYFYDDDSEVEDHIFCTYEFPGPTYKPAENAGKKPFDKGKARYEDLVAVTYSSINTNAFEPYGECVMGSKGTMLIEMERDVMLFGVGNRATDVNVKTAGGGKAVLEASGSEDPGANKQAASLGQAALGTGVPSRGYREEMEHFAYIIRHRDEGMESDKKKKDLKPRCDGRHAMADAILALTATEAMQRQERIVFDPEWFDDDPTHKPEWDRKEEKA
jgi:predicted dehydrogenase